MAKYDITKEATEDLYKIWAYTVDTWSEEQADTYYSLLEAGMNEVASAPERVDLRCEERQRCVSAVNLRIADSRLLNPDLGGVGNGVLHALLQCHYAVMPDAIGHLLCLEIPDQVGDDERHKNEYVKLFLHHTMIYHRARIEHLPCQTN